MATTQIEDDAIRILDALEQAPRNEYVDRNDIASRTGLPADRINDAMALLVNAGDAEWIQTFGTAPFDFNAAMITSRGRYQQQRLRTILGNNKRPSHRSDGGAHPSGEGAPAMIPVDLGLTPPPPIGSPFGFTDQDWETVARRKKDAGRLYSVFGHPFESRHFDTKALRQNVEAMLQATVSRYNATNQAAPIILQHRTLSAGYGEHLFNEIARDIIGSDIAVFETSDLNANVMLEMGVALTWGVRVLPIKVEGTPKPPSDVSGQTWADYRDSAGTFADPNHVDKLVAMIERALHKKVRAA